MSEHDCDTCGKSFRTIDHRRFCTVGCEMRWWSGCEAAEENASLRAALEQEKAKLHDAESFQWELVRTAQVEREAFKAELATEKAAREKAEADARWNAQCHATQTTRADLLESQLDAMTQRAERAESEAERLKDGIAFQKETLDVFVKAINEQKAALQAAEALAEGRLKVLNEKAEEVRREWQRAEVAEARLDAQIQDCAKLEEMRQAAEARVREAECELGKARLIAEEELRARKKVYSNLLLANARAQKAEDWQKKAEAETTRVGRLYLEEKERAQQAEKRAAHNYKAWLKARDAADTARREALEEAAKIAETYRKLWGSTVEGSQDPGPTIAAAIRALLSPEKEKP